MNAYAELHRKVFCKGLFTPSEIGSKSGKRSKNKRKTIKNKRQTSKKFFTIAFPFVRSEHNLNHFIIRLSSPFIHLDLEIYFVVFETKCLLEIR